MSEFFNLAFQLSLENNLGVLKSSWLSPDWDKIANKFSLEDVYIIGGFVRDSILKYKYGYNFPINDLDILIDSPKFRDFVENYPNKNRTRFGGLKFKYFNLDFSMDVFGIDNIFFLSSNPELEKNLENILKGCDLSTSALAYNPHTQKFYDVGAIDDINKKEINVNSHSYLKSAPTISRLILHSDKMNFTIGESGIDYIKKNYSPELDNEIMKFLKYKEVEHTFPLIKSKIHELI